MREYINRLSRGQYIYKQPTLTVQENCIEASVIAESVAEYTFSLSASDAVKDVIYSSNPKVTLLQNGYAGKEQVISYAVNGKGCQAGQTIEGAFHIVSSAGEMAIDYIFHVEEQYFDTSLGKAYNLFHFTNLVHEAPEEAAKVFTSQRFADVFLGEDQTLRNTYTSLLDQRNIRGSMEEFLLVLRKKMQVSLELDDSRRVFSHFHGNQKEYISLNKSSWGYFTMKVYADAPFIVLSTEEVTAEDFTGGKYELEYILDEAKLHGGKNFGKIYIETFHQKFAVEIEVHHTGTDAEAVEEIHFPDERREVQNAKVGLTKAYLEYRMKKCDMKAWILKSNEILNRVRGIAEQDPFFELAQAQMYLMEKREEEGKWILEHLKGQVMTDISDHVELYCYYLYVNSLLMRSPEYTSEAIALVKKYYENGYDSWTLLWILFYLKGNQDNNESVKLIRMKDAYKNGCTSPLMYFEACMIFNRQPQLLRVFNAFELQSITFGCKYQLIQDKLAGQISQVIGNEKVASYQSIRILEKLYQQYETDEILTVLVTHMIRNAYVADATYYEKGVLRGLRITRLYEYYLASLHKDYSKRIPKVVLMYFAYDNDLEYGLKAYLYANVIENQKAYGEVYHSYERNMELFVYEQLKEGHIDDSLVILYRAMWKKQLIAEETSGFLAKLLFMYKFTCFDEGVLAVSVKHKEQKEPVVYPLVNHQVFVPMYTEGCCVVFLCNDGQIRKDSVHYEMEKVFPDMPLKDEILASEEGNEGILLYRGVTYAQKGEYAAKAVLVWLQLLKHPAMNEAFHKKVNEWIIHYYNEYYTGDDFASFYGTMVKENLSLNGAKELTECCIHFGLFHEAYELIERYGYEQLAPAKVFRLVKYMIGVYQSDYNQLLVELGTYIFQNKVYDEDVLEYMMDYYNSTNDQMYQMWKACLNFAMEVSRLSERVLAQFLFTGEHTGRMTEIFTKYYGSGIRNMVVQAYISYNAYLYLIHHKKANDIVFHAIEHSFKEKKELPDTCYIAWLKHMTEIPQEQFSKERKELAQEILSILCREGKFYGFYKKLKGVLDIPYNALDKTIIEYVANPDSKVEIHYTYDNDENNEYISEIMKSSGGGIFTKAFSLLYGDKITYYFTVTGAGENITSEKNSYECSELNPDQSESRYDYINDCLASKELHDMVTMKKMMRSYMVKDYVTKQLFQPMKG